MSNAKDISFKGAGVIFFKFLKGDLKKGQGPIDLNLLHQQKLALIDAAAEEREAIGEDPSVADIHRSRAEAMDGIIEFLDGFQDMLVDNLQIWQYPKESEDAPK